MVTCFEHPKILSERQSDDGQRKSDAVEYRKWRVVNRCCRRYQPWLASSPYQPLYRSMPIGKIFTWITPLTLGALLGLYESLHGLFYVLYGTPDQKRDYPLEIVLGLPILFICLGVHWMIRSLMERNIRNIWIVEAVLAGLVIYGFYRS